MSGAYLFPRFPYSSIQVAILGLFNPCDGPVKIGYNTVFMQVTGFDEMDRIPPDAQPAVRSNPRTPGIKQLPDNLAAQIVDIIENPAYPTMAEAAAEIKALLDKALVPMLNALDCYQKKGNWDYGIFIGSSTLHGQDVAAQALKQVRQVQTARTLNDALTPPLENGVELPPQPPMALDKPQPSARKKKEPAPQQVQLPLAQA